MRKLSPWVTLLLTLIIGYPLAAQETTPPERLYRVNADGSGIQQLLADEDTAYWGPRWSFDGTKIALSVFKVGEKNGELYIVRSDGSNLTQLTHNGRSNYLPVWSPDDQTIVFISQDSDKVDTAEVYRIQADGTGETRLTDNTAWDYGMSWSPDGSRIAFGSEQGGTWGLYIMDADSSNAAPLSPFAHGNAPSWSPDGSRIAFTSNRDGDDDIYVTDVDGSDQRNITNNTNWDDQPSWSPDGSRIAFTSDRDGINRIYTMTADGGNVLPLLQASELTAAAFPSWSPDSQQLVFHARELTADERGTSPLPLAIGAVVLILGVVIVGLALRIRRR